MSVEKAKKWFEEKYYSSVYRKWRIEKEKAAKDIVGEEWEDFREKYYELNGFSAIKGVKISNYKPDLVVFREDGNPKILEEAKGHYVDSCFLKRAIGNYAEVIDYCLANNIPVPWFSLSCPTKMGNFEKIFNSNRRITGMYL